MVLPPLSTLMFEFSGAVEALPVAAVQQATAAKPEKRRTKAVAKAAA